MAYGTVIILNGASSSGKTSIIRELQAAFDEPVLEAGMDMFLLMLPKRYLNRPLWDDVLGLAIEAGSVGERLISGMHHAIAGLSRRGSHVAADHVLVERRWLEECATLLAELPAFLVGVRIPLDVLEEREQSRKERTPGQARAQHERVHAHAVYDLEVDTGRNSARECALQIKARVLDPAPPTAFRRIARR